MKNRSPAFLAKILLFSTIFGLSDVPHVLAIQENSFNWRNEMTGTFEPDLGEVFYGYDSKGQRVSKTWVKPTSEVVKTHYPTNSFNIAYHPDGSETITKHIFLNGLPIVTIETTKDPTGAKETKTYFNHPDHLNSLTVSSDEKADDAEHLLYQSFGRSLRNPNSIHQEQRNFTSHELDPETNYLYAGSRYLDPTIGRFLSQDPVFREIGGGINDKKLQVLLSDPQLLNSYSYARNNPLRFTDPDGEFIRENLMLRVVAPYLAKRAWENPAEAASLGASFIPGVSEGHDATSLITGIDPITGEQLSATDRVLSGIGLLPIVSGGMLKGGKKIVENVFSAISRLFRGGGKSIDEILKPGGKLIGSSGTRNNISVVTPREFQKIEDDLMATNPKIIQNTSYEGDWYELSNNGGYFGIRNSEEHGRTLDFDIPGYEKGFKIHQK